MARIHSSAVTALALLSLCATGAMAQSSVPTPTGVCVQNCGGGSSTTTTRRDSSGDEAEAEARRARLRVAAAAFDRAEKALGVKDYDTAIPQYRKAIENDPDNAAYSRRLNEALTARFRAKTTANTSALNEAQAIATYQRPSNAGTAATGYVYDTPKHNAELTPLVAVADPGTSASTEILNRLRIPLNLNDPKNVHVKVAMSKVEYMLKYNREARIKRNFPENKVELEKNIKELNDALGKVNVPPVTAERMQTAYNGYLLGLREAKQ